MAVDGCYARDLHDCAGKLSREHYLTRAVSRVIGRVTEVTGLHFLQDGLGIPSSTAKARILCERHNSMLSGLDAAAETFVSTLLDMDAQFCRTQESPQDRLVRLNGDDLERWFLKVLCGVTAAGVTGMNGAKSVSTLPTACAPVLFGAVPWPRNWGLYYLPTEFLTDDRRPANRFDHRLVVREEDHEVRALLSSLNGLLLVLALQEIEEVQESGVFRPEAIEFTGNESMGRIKFAWSGSHSQQIVRFLPQKFGDTAP